MDSTCLETKQILINQRRLIIPATRSLSMVNWRAILQEQSARLLQENSRPYWTPETCTESIRGRDDEDGGVQTQEASIPRRKLQLCAVVKRRRRLHGSTDARRSGPSTWVLFTPRTVLHACYFSSARSRHPLIPSTPLVATIALFMLDTPHRNPANTADTDWTCRWHFEAHLTEQKIQTETQGWNSPTAARLPAFRHEPEALINSLDVH